VSVLTLLAVYASDEGERIFDRKDSPRIVIDEIVGFLWSLALVGPTAGRIVAAFFLFRLFDIVKPPPARWCQERLRRRRSGRTWRFCWPCTFSIFECFDGYDKSDDSGAFHR